MSHVVVGSPELRPSWNLGAMNQGFVFARPEEWMLFWGSDDWAVSSTVLADLPMSSEQLQSTTMSPICLFPVVDILTLFPVPFFVLHHSNLEEC